MGILRGAGVVILSVILFLLLIIGGTFATLNKSLEYENVQPKVSPLATEIITEQINAENITDQLITHLNTTCLTESEIVQKFEERTFVIPCEIVSQGEEAIINHSINYLIEDFYYKNYECKFSECLENSEIPLFLISEQAKDYWKSLFYKSLFGILIALGLIILLTEKKSNGLILGGSISIASSLVILQLKGIGVWVGNLILSPISKALTETNSENFIKEIITIFFSHSPRIFLWFFIIGLILIATGITFKLTKFGFKIKEMLDKIKTKNKIESLENKVNKK